MQKEDAEKLGILMMQINAQLDQSVALFKIKAANLS